MNVTLRRCWPLFLTLWVASLLGGCGAAESLRVKPGVEGTARITYYRAMSELDAANYLEASSLFTRVAQSPSYVKYAALAQLRLADVLFLQGRFRAATAKYSAFVVKFPHDANMPYARYRAAEGYHKQLPSDLAILPPAYEGDQTVSIEARRELRRFLRDFPISRFAHHVRTMLAEVELLLCQHELYVASFYHAKGKPRAVSRRLQGAIDTYPKCALTEENVWRLGDAYVKAGSPKDAERAFGVYLKRFPQGKRASEVSQILQELSKKPANTPPSD